MISGLIMLLALIGSATYIFYYCLLFYACHKQYRLIFEMYRKGTERGLNMNLPSYSEISFNTSYQDYLKAKAYNEDMSLLYKEIETLEAIA